MDFHMQKVVEESFSAGMEVAERKAAKEKANSSKLFKERTEQIVKEYETRLASQKAEDEEEMTKTCESLQSQAVACSELVDMAASMIETWCQALGSSEIARKGLEEERKRLEEELASSRAALSAAEAKLSEAMQRMRRKEEKVKELEASLSGCQQSLVEVKSRWRADAELVQHQLQDEVSARLAAQEETRVCQEELKGLKASISHKAGRSENVLDNIDNGSPEDIIWKLEEERKQLKLRLLSLEKQVAEDERRHAKAMQQLQEKHVETLLAERNAKAFSEQVAQRLEHELLQLSTWALKKRGYGKKQMDFQVRLESHPLS
ncbi:hypothetical protein GUITHDRAFT_103315 [Guillardia theta CCMP2712]|uniref:Uncharacterized protein n=1 Tax=Guillardia theta (strain CCMP2712) TaxID=905079 RepID=L1JR13_GUITC|nr:hypothetical protein GUITHDRAFT_103315 [Guillardia theta CCMP2712]EKX50724.1 hypothetical protein GUITHDRAFT_103315 [Guillardia theta CCMP2712]|eukprot:XP_005837704.1 hypothetical protein GUITHDRAFT_103315 [Guillardia theta CCMP2712]